MAVQRNIGIGDYAKDKNGSPVEAADVKEKARHVYPIDDYEIPASLTQSARLGDHRILKVPLLGQFDPDHDDWCGRTSMSMMYNWFELLKEANPKDGYITHWDVDGKHRMNLRFADGRRAFMSTPEKTALDNEVSYGHFGETINEVFGKSYRVQKSKPTAPNESEEFPTILRYPGPEAKKLELGDKSAAAKRAADAADLDENKIRDHFKQVIQSIDLNNPVFLYSGVTTGTNHLILLVGYAYITDPGGESLWIAVADPAAGEFLFYESWKDKAGWHEKVRDHALDLRDANFTLEHLTPAHQAIMLVRGGWYQRRAGMYLVRAKFFFQSKKTSKFFQSISRADKRPVNEANSALVLDDVGNPRPGGQIIFSHDTVNEKAPAGAVIGLPASCVFPLNLPGISSYPIPALHCVEQRSKTEGGNYPLGRYHNLHGGLHYPTAGAADPVRGQVPVRAIAPGRIVAARLRKALANEAQSAPPPEAATKEADLANDLSGNTPDFVLVRHDIEIVKKDVPIKDHEVFPIYSLYMHLAGPSYTENNPPSAGSDPPPYSKVEWFKRLIQERFGRLTVVDPEPQYKVGGKKQDSKIGDHFAPKPKPADELITKGDYSVLGRNLENMFSLQVTENKTDKRVSLVAVPPPKGAEAAANTLHEGKVITFCEPHRNAVVDAGDIIGFADPTSKLGTGFIHWEILAPAGKGVQRLVDLAKECGLDIFKQLDDTSPNNLLDAEEAKTLHSFLPKEDDKIEHWENASELRFAGNAPQDHYRVRLDFRNYLNVLGAGPRKLDLAFEGRDSAGAHTATQQITVDVTKDADLHSQWIDVPGWANAITIESSKLMVRRQVAAPETTDVDQHMKDVASHRMRNVQLRHLNEWNKDDMTNAVTEWYSDGDGKLADFVSALSFWGGDEKPCYGDKGLFGGGADQLPASTKIDNIHPVVALWLLNVLVERGKIDWRVPAFDASAVYAGFLPVVDSRPDGLPGDSIAAVAVTDILSSDVAVTMRAVSSDAQFSLGTAPYIGDTFVGSAEISGWGDFKLKVQHQLGVETPKDQDPKSIGKDTLTILEPVPSPYMEMPEKQKSGLWRWELEFDDNRPTKLLGYLIADARIGGGPMKETVAAIPIVAVRPPDGPTGKYELGYLTGAPRVKDPDNTAVAAGIYWREIKDARNPKVKKLKLARKLLKALSALNGKYTEKTKRDFQLVTASLAEDGCSVGVYASGGTVDKQKKTREENTTTLKDLVANVPDLSVEPKMDKAGKLNSLVLSVPLQPDDETPGGPLVVEFNAKELYGTVLAKMQPKGDDVVEMFLRCRFYNGGHVIPMATMMETTSTGELKRTGILTEDDFKAVTQKHLTDFVSPSRVVSLAMPRIEKPTYQLQGDGLALSALLVGGDLKFWNAAKPVFKVGGTPLASGVSKTAAKSAAGHQVTAQCNVTGKKSVATGSLSIHVETTADAEFANTLIAAGVKSADLSYEAKPEVSDVKVDPTSTKRLYTLVAKVHAIFPSNELVVKVTQNGEDFVAKKRVKVKPLKTASVVTDEGIEEHALGSLDFRGDKTKLADPIEVTATVELKGDPNVNKEDTFTYP